MFSRKKPREPAISTLVGAGTRVLGDLEFSGGCLIDGHVIGNVRSVSDDTAILRVSERGCVEGTVDVPTVVLNGTVEGDVRASKRVELGAKSRVVGNVDYKLIEMAIGAEVHGKLIHGAVSGRQAVEQDELVEAVLSAESQDVAEANLMGELK